jgi:hypothetical protein
MAFTSKILSITCLIDFHLLNGVHKFRPHFYFFILVDDEGAREKESCSFM